MRRMYVMPDKQTNRKVSRPSNSEDCMTFCCVWFPGAVHRLGHEDVRQPGTAVRQPTQTGGPARTRVAGGHHDPVQARASADGELRYVACVSWLSDVAASQLQPGLEHTGMRLGPQHAPGGRGVRARSHTQLGGVSGCGVHWAASGCRDAGGGLGGW